MIYAPFHSHEARARRQFPVKSAGALKIKSGDRLEYAIEGKGVMIRVHPGIQALKALASKRGKNFPFARIREDAAKAALARRGRR